MEMVNIPEGDFTLVMEPNNTYILFSDSSGNPSLINAAKKNAGLGCRSTTKETT